MGTTPSCELGPLAVAAVSEITRFDLEQVRRLQQLFCASDDQSDDDEQSNDCATASIVITDWDDNSNTPSLSQPTPRTARRRVEPTLSATQFQHALVCADIYNSDVAIFDRMFTLLDRTGDEVIVPVEFLVSICVLLHGDLEHKLTAAFDVVHSDTSQQQQQQLTTADVAFVLHTLAQAANYFGDPAMPQLTALSIADDVFAAAKGANAKTEANDGGEEAKDVDDNCNRSPTKQARDDPCTSSTTALLPVDVIIARLTQHPVVQQYVQGELITNS